MVYCLGSGNASKTLKNNEQHSRNANVVVFII